MFTGTISVNKHSVPVSELKTEASLLKKTPKYAGGNPEKDKPKRYMNDQIF
jgi:hypothetical protein